jgi:hypothetical protein
MIQSLMRVQCKNLHTVCERDNSANFWFRATFMILIDRHGGEGDTKRVQTRIALPNMAADSCLGLPHAHGDTRKVTLRPGVTLAGVQGEPRFYP